MDESTPLSLNETRLGHDFTFLSIFSIISHVGLFVLPKFDNLVFATMIMIKIVIRKIISRTF